MTLYNNLCLEIGNIYKKNLEKKDRFNWKPMWNVCIQLLEDIIHLDFFAIQNTIVQSFFNNTLTTKLYMAH